MLKNPYFRKIIYYLYDKFWYLEKFIVKNEFNIDEHQINTYNIKLYRLKYTLKQDFPSYKKFKIKKMEDNFKNVIKIEDSHQYSFLREHFIENKKWEDCVYYNKFENSFKENLLKFENQYDFKNYLKNLDNIFSELKKSEKNYEKYQISAIISKNGNYIVIDEIWIVCILKLLDYKKCIVNICYRDEEWINFKKELLSYLVAHNLIYQPLLHPDLTTIKSSYKEERFEIIKKYLTVKSGKLLDIGANFGYFCHKFEELGFDCYAVEIRPHNVYFMKRLRDIEGKTFKIINKSIFDLKGDLNFDVVLALNIFHHFLKEKETFNELIKFLKRLRVKEMFFQAYIPSESDIKNSYITFKPKEFVEFIIKNSCLNNYELIAEKYKSHKKQRPIFKIF
ncbi:MAG: class I SAM-dependent methyltransferase [Candidatus Helarchaeota archaeon]